ncbi:MAG TPA: class I SAM-dependent methyltransferase [Patescibacteria group bacterium]|nr:class I SAM-dependent methyltransferase [bacterium]HRY57021.1 class I SAM-dependent methyltransferase [Patescibacteria group bacterium]
MIVITGDKKNELDKETFRNICGKYEKVILDLGTGDGRFVFKNALKNKSTLYIGLDPAEKQIQIYSKKSNRRRLKNALYVIGSLENLPDELYSTVDKIFINLPWGTLLEKIVKSNETYTNELFKILKKNGEIEIIFGYVPELEPSETERLDLPVIENESDVLKAFSTFKKIFEVIEMKRLLKDELEKIETTWAKKLKFGKDRFIYKIVLRKIAV